MAIAAVGGDRALKKPPLIRSAQAFGPMTLEIVWSIDEALPYGCIAPYWHTTNRMRTEYRQDIARRSTRRVGAFGLFKPHS